MKKLLWLVALGALVAVTFAAVDLTSPPWYERIRYPLRYSEFVRVHAQRHGLDPDHARTPETLTPMTPNVRAVFSFVVPLKQSY